MATDANPPYRFGGLLARARRSWVEQIRERMQEAGFPGYRQSDAWVLALLLQRPLAIGQLGEAQGISRQAARQMADGLVERGYATFGTDDADARRTLVVLTRRGKAYGRAIWIAQDALNETVRSRVSEADLAAADTVLRAVFPDDNARQQVDKRRPPPSENPLSAVFAPLLEQAENEPGTLLYAVHRSKDDPHVFWTTEVYADDDAFAARRASECMPLPHRCSPN